MSFTPATEKLIQSLQLLPGIGIRSAQRIALHLLEREPQEGQNLSSALSGALATVKKCPSCRSLTEAEQCDVCANPDRDASLICVVMSDADKEGIELSGHYTGRYFVLHGALSPIDGIGPEQLGIWQLIDHINASAGSIKEVLIALDDQMESDATAYFISEQLKKVSTPCSRIKFSHFKSGDLNKADSRVIADALENKKIIGFEHD